MTVYSVRIMRSDERTRPPLQLLTHYRDTPPADSVLDPRLDDATNGALSSASRPLNASNLTSRPFVFFFCHAMPCHALTVCLIARQPRCRGRIVLPGVRPAVAVCERARICVGF